MTFRVGQKVCCIIDADRWETFGHPKPERGKVYTVSGIDPADEYPLSLFLIELGRASYWASGFRRVTDISVFTKMLTPQKVDA